MRSGNAQNPLTFPLPTYRSAGVSPLAAAAEHDRLIPGQRGLTVRLLSRQTTRGAKWRSVRILCVNLSRLFPRDAPSPGCSPILLTSFINEWSCAVPDGSSTLFSLTANGGEEKIVVFFFFFFFLKGTKL